MVYHGTHRTTGDKKWYNEPSNDAGTLNKTYLGIVKDAQDPQKMGRLLAWLPELTGDPNKEENWVLCSYCSPFAGASFFDVQIHTDKGLNTQRKDQLERAGHRTPDLQDNVYSGRQSYGMWFVPPDIGNEILITFINGDPSRAVWFGCLYQQDHNHMVPGVASDTIFSGGDDIMAGEQGPVLEHDSREGFNPDSPRRKLYQPLRDSLKFQQGLDKDVERGQTSSSAQRESPSEVFGILTPDGNSFVMDDSQDEETGGELIRLRTKSGVQILFHQTKGFIYMITKDGKTWIELSNEGNVDVYSEKNVSVHSLTQDINLKAGRDINIQAGNDINIRADRDVKLVANRHYDINIAENMTSHVVKKYDLIVNENMTTRVNQTYNLKVTNDLVNETTTGTINIKAKSNVAINSEAAIGITATANLSEQAANIFMNSGPGPQALSTAEANEAEFPPSHNEPGPATQASSADSWESGEEYEDGDNIVARVPQHEPWEIHEIQTLGTSRNIVESPPGPEKLGATTADAIAPLSVTTPLGERLEDGFYNAADLPEFPTVFDIDPACIAAPVTRQISQKGVNLIKKFEGEELTVYQDVAGLDTVGVGHLLTAEEKADGAFASGRITQEQSDALLLQDLELIQRGVRGCLTQNVTQDQYDALVSMAFNIGTGAFCNSTLVKKLNDGDYVEAPNQMMRWTKARVNGNLTSIQGLINRRKAEANLFAAAPPDNCS